MSAGAVVPGLHMTFADSPDPASWIGDRRMAWEPEAGYRVGNEVPQGYARYLRVLHRSKPPRDRQQIRSWRESRPSPGMPEERVLRALVSTFGKAASTEPTVCWFAYWKGWGALEENLQMLTGLKAWSPAVVEKASFALWHRAYVLLSGPLESVLNRPGRPTPALSPQLWWPEDQRWFVATEIDLDFSLVGADESLANAISDNGDIDVQDVSLEDRLDAAGASDRLQ
jgi:hypothetical protein